MGGVVRKAGASQLPDLPGRCDVWCHHGRRLVCGVLTLYLRLCAGTQDGSPNHAGWCPTPVLEEELADLRALAAPEGDEDLLAAIYDDLEAVLRAIRQLAAAAAAGDLAAIEQLTSNEDQGHAGLRVVATAFSDLDIRAGEYGLTVCGD